MTLQVESFMKSWIKMFGYMKITTPEGKVIKVAKNLYLRIAERLAEDQVYEFYTKFLDYMESLSIEKVYVLAREIYKKVEEESFLYNLNASTDKNGNVDWDYFFKDVEFS